MKFKVGDKVRIPNKYIGCLHRGYTGIVIEEYYNETKLYFYIKWDYDKQCTYVRPEHLVKILGQLEFNFME